MIARARNASRIVQFTFRSSFSSQSLQVENGPVELIYRCAAIVTLDPEACNGANKFK
ncbi:MAG: hypothetical protein ABSF53_15195 [Terracidiphilus sp.]|jgi:hypothetical protein